MAGPYDNSDRIIRQLERSVGPGNFDYVVGDAIPGELLLEDEDYE